mgnify:CR=1 FL=1
MSQPDNGECPICHTLVSADELLDCSGLCALCDKKQTDFLIDQCPPVEKEDEIDEAGRKERK